RPFPAVRCRPRSCAPSSRTRCRTSWCRPPSSSCRRCRSTSTARSTGGRSPVSRRRRRARGSRRPVPQRRSARPSKSWWPRSGPSCCTSTGWGRTTASSSSAATRCSPSRPSPACARLSASRCRCARSSRSRRWPASPPPSRPPAARRPAWSPRPWCRRRATCRSSAPSRSNGSASSAVAPPPLVDLRALPAAAREPEAFARLIAESVLPFDLVRGPLWRPCFFRLGEDDLLLYFAIHHIVCDGVSISILLRELVILYGAFARGDGSPLPLLPLQYADFAAWQRSWLQGEALARQVAFWRQQLTGAPVVIELPTDRPRPAVQTSHGARRYFSLPAPLVKDLAALGRRERCTLFMTLQGVLNA